MLKELYQLMIELSNIKTEKGVSVLIEFDSDATNKFWAGNDSQRFIEEFEGGKGELDKYSEYQKKFLGKTFKIRFNKQSK